MEAVNTQKSVLILELNEFNTDLLDLAAKKYKLPNLCKLVESTRYHYKTNDRYNSGYLEPWVQWVSIHTGTPSRVHQIKHLGDVPDLKAQQTWEALGQHDITTGIWGVMNGARRDQSNAQFFLPDPWTFDEPAYPPKLNALLDLPRYVSKNYRNLKISKLISKSLRLFKFIFTSGQGMAILKATVSLLKQLIQHGRHHYLYIAYFDYISTRLFIQYKQTLNPTCSIIFLNSLAHIQHHHWTEGADEITPQILHGLKNIDTILGLLTQAFPNDAFVVHNGLSQMNTNHEKPWVLYRQKDPYLFLKAMKLDPVRVEQHMTHDGHAFFKTPEACQTAFDVLKSFRIIDKTLFHVEKNTENPCKLFYQLSFTDALDHKETPVTSRLENIQGFKFYQYFDRIVTRTGRHIPVGTVFSNDIPFVDHMFNHEFNKYIHHYLAPQHFPLKSVQVEYKIEPTTQTETQTENQTQSESLCVP